MKGPIFAVLGAALLASCGDKSPTAPAPAARAAEEPAETYFPPPEAKGGWRRLTAPDDIRAKAGIDPEKLAAFADWLARADDRPFAAVLIRRGWLVLLASRAHDPAKTSGNLKSCNKALVATVLACAVEKTAHSARPLTLDSPAFDFLPDAQPLSDPRKAKITVRMLLNHTSGLAPEAAGAQNQGPWEYVFGKTGDEVTERLAFDPGTDLRYSTHGFYHAARVIEGATGEDYAAFARKALAEPLGIGKWNLASFDGATGAHANGAGGLPALELARVAYCLLRGGQWGERQVVPKWFVEATLHPSHMLSGTKDFGRDAAAFTLGWEIPSRQSAADRDLPADARWKPGSNGQLVAWVPSLDLVLVRTTGKTDDSLGNDWPYAECLRRAFGVVANDR